MALLLDVLLIGMTASTMALPTPTERSTSSYPFPFISRKEWGARPAASFTALELPVPFVVIHHTYIPKACSTTQACKNSMRTIQNMHQLINGWLDIGYNFAVGGDGSVYEGRGWNAVGAHALGYNSQSIGIVLIGDFVENTPPKNQMQMARELIKVGVDSGFISPSYQLIGHRQATTTECPGQALFEQISTWDHFQSAV